MLDQPLPAPALINNLISALHPVIGRSPLGAPVPAPNSRSRLRFPHQIIILIAQRVNFAHAQFSPSSPDVVQSFGDALPPNGTPRFPLAPVHIRVHWSIDFSVPNLLLIITRVLNLSRQSWQHRSSPENEPTASVT